MLPPIINKGCTRSTTLHFLLVECSSDLQVVAMMVMPPPVMVLPVVVGMGILMMTRVAGIMVVTATVVATTEDGTLQVTVTMAHSPGQLTALALMKLRWVCAFAATLSPHYYAISMLLLCTGLA
jgi:hypothetical protein